MDTQFILHLNGFPGTGKLTTAKQICDTWDNVRMIDNHATADPIFQLWRLDGTTKCPEEAWGAVKEIRRIVMQSFRRFSDPSLSFVFTHCLAAEYPEDAEVMKDVEGAAIDAGRIYIPVVLQLSFEENKRRMMMPDRANRKMQNTKELEEIRGEYTLLGQNHNNALVLDVTELQPHESADRIRTHVQEVLTV